jgi:hypothetical protein
LRRLAVLVLTPAIESGFFTFVHLIKFVQAALFRANNLFRLFAKTDVNGKLDSRHFLSIKLGCSLYFYLRYAVSAQSVNASD